MIASGLSALITFGLSIGALWLGAELFVSTAARVARRFGLSELVVGLTVVAMGTSAPEIVASAAAARRGMGDIAAGNLIGSNVFNALLILGITSTITSIEIVEAAIGTTVWLLGLSVITAVLLGTNGKLGRLEGAVLVAINLTRWLLDVL